MRYFGVMGPNRDKIIPHKAETLAECREKLLIGYEVVNEIVDGICVPPMSDGLKHYTYMTHLLLTHGLELREWLAENGCVCKCGAEPSTETRKKSSKAVGDDA